MTHGDPPVATPTPSPGRQRHPGSWGHLLVRDVQMLSQGLRSGCHGDGLFKFAFGIQPEFSGNLGRRKTLWFLSSKDSTRAAGPAQATCSCSGPSTHLGGQGPASRAVALPGGNRPLAGSPDGRPDPHSAPSAAPGDWRRAPQCLLSGHTLTPGCPFSPSCLLSTAGTEAGGGNPLHQRQTANKNTDRRQPSPGREPICRQGLLTLGFQGALVVKTYLPMQEAEKTINKRRAPPAVVTWCRVGLGAPKHQNRSAGQARQLLFTHQPSAEKRAKPDFRESI